MSDGQQGRLARFGVFELDLKAGELRRGGRLVSLTGQPVRVLTLLVTHAGEVVTRDDMRREIWSETHVDFQASLSTCINQIRTALGDRAASPRFVETLPRRGYRFIAPVEIPAASATGGPPERARIAAFLRARRSVTIAAAALLASIAVLLIPLSRGVRSEPIHIVVVPVTFEPSRVELKEVSVSLTDALMARSPPKLGRARRSRARRQ